MVDCFMLNLQKNAHIMQWYGTVLGVRTGDWMVDV